MLKKNFYLPFNFYVGITIVQAIIVLYWVKKAEISTGSLIVFVAFMTLCTIKEVVRIEDGKITFSRYFCFVRLKKRMTNLGVVKKITISETKGESKLQNYSGRSKSTFSYVYRSDVALTVVDENDDEVLVCEGIKQRRIEVIASMISAMYGKEIKRVYKKD